MSDVETFEGFPKGTFDFLRGIAKHNEKAWLDAHREDYERFYVAPARLLVEELGPRLKKSLSKGLSFDPRVNGSLFRIQRDTRFAKDKTPYKTHLDLWLWEGQKRGWDTPGFFFRMFPDRLMIGCGIHGFEKVMLAKYRDAVIDPRRGAALEKAIDAVRASDAAYEIGGATRAKVPRGFDAEHPRASLLLHEGLWAGLEGPVPKEARSAAFVDWLVAHAERFAPIHRWLGALRG